VAALDDFREAEVTQHRTIFVSGNPSRTIAAMSRVFLVVLIGTLMSTASTGCKSNQHPVDPGPTGASAAFTTSDPVIQQAQDLMKDGKFK
jgi:hypothetical protein